MIRVRAAFLLTLVATASCAGGEPAPVDAVPDAAPVGVAPPAPPALSRRIFEMPNDDAPTPRRDEIPDVIRLRGDSSRLVFVTAPSDLIWPAKGPVPGRIDLDGRTIWSGPIVRRDVVPDVLAIELDAPIPTTGTLHVTVVVGDRKFDVATEARAGEFLEIRCGTRGPTLGWNPGYKYY